MDKGIDWPAWTQAIGSVIAIFVAVLAPIWHADREARKRTETQLSSVLAIAEDSWPWLSQVPADAFNPAGEHKYIIQNYRVAQHERVVEALRAIPIYLLEDHRFAEPVLHLANALDELREAVPDIGCRFDTPNSIPDAFVLRVVRAAMTARKSIQRMQSLVSEYRR